MRRISILAFAAIIAGMLIPMSKEDRANADPIPKEYRKTIKKGLDWLITQQLPDGHWSSPNNAYPTPMTGLAGIALLMEGSTIKSGRYSKNIRKAVDWCIAKSQVGGGKDGLIGDTNNPQERARYMYGHGFTTLFLASVYGDEADLERRKKLKDVLTRAALYIAKAQSTKGGWYYTSAKDGHDNDEGSVTVTQVQALRACKNAGIAVPKQTIEKAQEYLQKSTTSVGGGVIYRLGSNGSAPAQGGERPALTAAAISCAFGAGDYKSPIVKKWFKYCKGHIGYGAGASIGHDDYTHYYYAQALFILGDDGWQKLFGEPGAKNGLTWSDYRSRMFKFLQSTQNPDGSWNPRGGWGVGQVFATSINLTIMQLDNGSLPIHER